MKFRPDAQRVEVYNEGLAVFLHDPANAQEILRLNPASILGMSDVATSKDKGLKTVVERGLLVTYYLRQDDPIVVDVSVGPPLSKAEIKKCGVPLMKPTQTIISIPSGVLRIDTGNTCRLSADAQAYAEEYEKEHGSKPDDSNLQAFGLEDKSGEVRVPKGDYVLTLYRVDFDKMDDDEDGEFDGPGEFITLTPASEIERPKKILRVLEYGQGYARIAGLRAWKITDGIFHGIIVGGNISNFNWHHANALGLRRGQRIIITHENKAHDAIFLGGIEPRSNPDLAALVLGNALDKVVSQHPGLLTAAIHMESIAKTPLLWIQTTEPGKYLSGEKGSALVIEPTDEFLLPPPDTTETPQGELCDGAIVGRVLASGVNGIELGCDAKTLKKLKPGKAAELTLEIGGKTAPIVLLPDMDHRHRPYHIVGTHSKQPDKEFFMRIFSYMIEGGDDVFRAIVGKKRSAELTALLKQYKAGCTFNSSEGYKPKDEAAGEALRKRGLELWKEGVSRWAVPGSMSALFITHWDDRMKSSLSCRPIQYQDENIFANATGAEFKLRLVE